MSRNTITHAQRALERAEDQIREAERAREKAHAQLEAAFAERGWTRLFGAFTLDATPLYVSVLFPNSTLSADQVLDVLARQERAAA